MSLRNYNNQLLQISITASTKTSMNRLKSYIIIRLSDSKHEANGERCVRVSLPNPSHGNDKINCYRNTLLLLLKCTCESVTSKFGAFYLLKLISSVVNCQTNCSTYTLSCIPEEAIRRGPENRAEYTCRGLLR